MSRLDEVLEGARQAALDACWEQWIALQSQHARWRSVGKAESLGPPDTPRAMVDPEALVLASLALRTDELRLDDMLLWIAEESNLLSTQRIAALLRDQPAGIGRDLAWFAARCRVGDARWTRLAEGASDERRGRPGKSMPTLSLQRDAAFVLRMRSGLGVGIKADVIALLTGLRSAANQHAGGVSVADLVAILGYSSAATRQAVEQMARAGFVDRIESRPARYRIGSMSPGFVVRDAHAPGHLLAPPWGYAAQAFAILIACDRLARDARIAEASATVQASRLRDLYERFAPYWSWFDSPPIDAVRHPGERFLDAFRLTLEPLVRWVKERL
ncbi:MAG: helix-turn-helix domain-containing protein [Planctomycetota bacterium]